MGCCMTGKGIASVDGKDYSLQNGSVVEYSFKKTHHLKNSSTGNLIIIEVQTGEYFGGDDRGLEGKYGRVLIPSRFLRLTLLASSSASSTYYYIRLRSLLLAASLSFESEMVLACCFSINRTVFLNYVQ